MKSMTKSKLSHGQIGALARGCFGENAELLSVTEQGGGMFNTAYILTLRNMPDGIPGELVLKASVAPGGELLTSEKNAVRAEAGVIGRLREAGVPVPEIVGTDYSRALVDRDCFFMTRLPGVTWHQLNTALSYENKQRLKERLGEYAALIHSVTSGRFGYPSSDKTFDTWREAFLSMLEDLAGDARRRRLGLPYKEILVAAASRADLLDEIKTPRLVDFDLSAGNILLVEKGGAYELGGIVDFERAFYGDPYADFVSAMMIFDDAEREPSFLKGYEKTYGRKLAFGDNDRARLLLYRIYMALLTAVEACRYPRGFSQYIRSACKKQIECDLTGLNAR